MEDEEEDPFMFDNDEAYRVMQGVGIKAVQVSAADVVEPKAGEVVVLRKSREKMADHFRRALKGIWRRILKLLGVAAT
jgi:hypothetical protein